MAVAAGRAAAVALLPWSGGPPQPLAPQAGVLLSRKVPFPPPLTFFEPGATSMRLVTPMRSHGNMRNDESAETGIGTMIVFIAAVLVAAIAAGVLISTSGKLQEKSSRTGEEATEQVASNMAIQSVVGKRDATSDSGLKDMEIYLSLSPGASELDLEQLKIQIQNATQIKTLSYAQAASATAFSAAAVRDADGSFSAAAPVMTAGDLVKIVIELDTASLEFEPRDSIRVVLLPEVGSSVSTGFNTPNSYGTKTVLELV